MEEAALAQAGEVTVRAEDELGAGLLLLRHLNPHLCFPLFPLGMAGGEKSRKPRQSQVEAKVLSSKAGFSDKPHRKTSRQQRLAALKLKIQSHHRN